MPYRIHQIVDVEIHIPIKRFEPEKNSQIDPLHQPSFSFSRQPTINLGTKRLLTLPQIGHKVLRIQHNCANREERDYTSRSEDSILLKADDLDL